MTSKHEHQRPRVPERPASPLATTEAPSLSGGAGAPRKPYTPPAIIHELALETRAGSPLGIDPLDPFGLDPDKQ